jgi:hypothetical protein
LSEPLPDSAPDPAPAADRWEDYVDVFISPAELFRRRAHGSLAHPVVTLGLASMLLYYIMIPANNALLRESVPTDPRAAAFMEQYGSAIQIVLGLLAPISVLTGVAFAAILIRAACSLLDVRVTFRDAFLIATFAGFIALLGQAVGGLLVMLRSGPVDAVRDLSFGVLRFTGDDDIPRALLPLLGRFDVFALWQAVVWGIGVRVIGNASRGQAALTAGVAWLLYAIPRMLLSVLPQPTPPTGAG